MKIIFVEVEQLLLLNENNFVEICYKVNFELARVKLCNTFLWCTTRKCRTTNKGEAKRQEVN